MKEIIIRHILSWLVGITAEQWRAAISRVVTLAEAKWPSKEKADAFNSFTHGISDRLPTWAINLVREMALAYARRKGLIK